MLKIDRKRKWNRAASGQGRPMLRSVLLIVSLSFSSAALSADAPATDIPPSVRNLVTPAAALDVVHIRPFTLDQGYTFDWRQERPLLKSGTLLVLKVNPGLVYPRDAAMPVLYVGAQTAQRLNHGHESGYVVAIVPGDVDLSRDLVWFGAPDLPEWANAQSIAAENAKARAAGIKPFDASRVRSVTADRLSTKDLASLLGEQIAPLVLTYSPQEHALAQTWRLPVAQR